MGRVVGGIKWVAHRNGIKVTTGNMTIKDMHANLMVESNMEGGTLILVQLETIVIHVAITLNLVVAMENLEVDVRVEETYVIIMEE